MATGRGLHQRIALATTRSGAAEPDSGGSVRPRLLWDLPGGKQAARLSRDRHVCPNHRPRVSTAALPEALWRPQPRDGLCGIPAREAATTAPVSLSHAARGEQAYATGIPAPWNPGRSGPVGAAVSHGLRAGDGASDGGPGHGTGGSGWQDHGSEGGRGAGPGAPYGRPGAEPGPEPHRGGHGPGG